ncbi:hypothetical protein PROFUN_15585 [Planoprotostelium fungivorum]|uniref:Uncharacterized protein n=1 Tax=Planoprotostelium fungivorum TaxID=1890364 RepID=A0A2P6MVN0_9EUKA|nr:hypothetical protein PROFUN_15585 [Planoprotostelium fungivorum]
MKLSLKDADLCGFPEDITTEKDRELIYARRKHWERGLPPPTDNQPHKADTDAFQLEGLPQQVDCCAQHSTSLTNWKTRRKVSENSATIH